MVSGPFFTAIQFVIICYIYYITFYLFCPYLFVTLQKKIAVRRACVVLQKISPLDLTKGGLVCRKNCSYMPEAMEKFLVELFSKSS